MNINMFLIYFDIYIHSDSNYSHFNDYNYKTIFSTVQFTI